MRYWVVRRRFKVGPWRVRRREKRVVSRVGASFELELSFEGVDFMVGGSCRWSPAKTTFFAESRGIQHCASSA
jgi:hypothetical protein